MASKILFIMFAVLAFVTLASAAPLDAEVKKCDIVADFIPSRIKNCSSGINVQCTGSTVCYSWIETLKTLPCLLQEYPISALFKMNQCGMKIKYKVLPEARVCITESELRKFYNCFDDGA